MRKRIILSLVFSFVLVLIVIPLTLLFYRAPTCSDGSLNGDEKGIDCGGSCQKLCTAESLPIVMKGDPRILKVASSTYEVVALLDNPNSAAEINHAVYYFKLYEQGSSVPVKTISGQTFVPRGGEFAIFEGPFTIPGGSVPTLVVLEWQKESLVWQKAKNERPALTVKKPLLSNEEVVPHLEATLENQTLGTLTNIDLIALISDAEGNTFAASKTFVDELAPGESTSIIFSWPRPFLSKAHNIEIVPRVFPDPSYLR
jgi:hypothetical protein